MDKWDRTDPISASLDGRVAVVTGVSRAGIGFAVARELLAAGARVLVHSWARHDAAQPWGADPAGVQGVVNELGGVGPCLAHVSADLADPVVILFTSGQHLAPMSQELPYAISKGAIHQMTLSLSDALADRGITVNTVNPGPVDTGWADPDLTARVAHALPAGRWGHPDDVARLVRWLACDDSAWITGQIINSEGGFRRWTM